MDSFLEIIAISCGTVMFFGVFLAFFAYIRYLRYREIITLAEKGLVHPRYAANGKGTLYWGFVIASVGIALCLGLYPLGWVIAGGTFPLNFGPWMLVGLIPTFFGLALMAIYYLSHREDKTKAAPPVLTPAQEPFDDDPGVA
jgi:hypothetical protein